ncbi:MAG: hypothetical protein JWN56_1515 [Sphingobacteriales bacterium]|nr:hypothetical protein [Sphingobacteriales bacterium]
METLTNEQIKEIAEQLDCGFKCYWNKESGELVFIPEGLDDFDVDPEEGWSEELEKLDNNPDDYVEIDRLTSRDSFQIMEDFVETLNDSSNVKKRLIAALSKKKPFREFKFIIDNSGDYRQMWFDFKAQEMQNWVREKIEEITGEEEED